MIDLRERAAFQIPFLPLPALEFDCRGRVRPWVGRDPEEGETAAEDAPVLVYMTEHGEVYHTTSRCSHLSLSIRRVPGTPWNICAMPREKFTGPARNAWETRDQPAGSGNGSGRLLPTIRWSAAD